MSTTSRSDDGPESNDLALERTVALLVTDARDEMRPVTLHSIGDLRAALTDAAAALRKLDD